MILKIITLLSILSLHHCKKANANPESGSTEDKTLIGGRPADLKDWPASVYAHMGNAACTATIVGEQVLIIASHCVSHGGSASFSIGANSYTSTCSRSPLYRRGVDHDLALCKISRKVENVTFENVNLNPDLVKLGDEILLTGYGCIQKGGGGGNDGIYRIGEAKVTALPKPYDYYTNGKAALCFGDSGGPAFAYLDAEKKVRVQISVNSKGDINVESLLSSTSTQASIDFIKQWSSDNSVAMCGVHADAKGCRGAVEPPKPPKPEDPKPTVCKDMYKKLENCIKEDVLSL